MNFSGLATVFHGRVLWRLVPQRRHRRAEGAPKSQRREPKDHSGGYGAGTSRILRTFNLACGTFDLPGKHLRADFDCNLCMGGSWIWLSSVCLTGGSTTEEHLHANE